MAFVPYPLLVIALVLAALAGLLVALTRAFTHLPPLPVERTLADLLAAEVTPCPTCGRDQHTPLKGVSCGRCLGKRGLWEG